MAIPPAFVTDLAAFLNGAFCDADLDWVTGKLLSEEPLLSNLLRQFEYRTLSARPLGVTISSGLLHRRGIRSTDLYGSDLLLSVSWPAFSFHKIAIHQLKIHDGVKAKFQLDQLQSALGSPFGPANAFVWAADSRAHTCSVEGAQSVISRFRTQKGVICRTSLQSCSAWQILGDWFEEWLTCTQGTSASDRHVRTWQETTSRSDAVQFVTDEASSRWLPRAWIGITIDGEPKLQEYQAWWKAK